MIYEEYMLFPVTWEQSTGTDPDTRMDSYAAPVNIKVFRYGSFQFIRDAQSGSKVSAQKYITVDAVTLGDKINGQVVKSCEPIPEFDGTQPIFEVVCW